MSDITSQSATSAIKDWPENERPRERLIKHGPEGLSDAQLLAILLRTGHKRQNAVGLAFKLIAHFGGLSALSQASIAELCKMQGIGPAKAAHLKAALELGRRAVSSPLSAGVKIRGSQDVYRHYHAHLRSLKHELFKVILLDGKNRIIRDSTISEGSLTLSIVHPREVFNPAIRDSAGAVIFIHNHPSGDPTPSREDHQLTKRLVACGELLGIKVLDHLVVGDARYFSFADQGCL
jgi:DNA repair protein RadC